MNLKRDELGMATSEYAVGTVGSVCCACALIKLAPEAIDLTGWFVDHWREMVEQAFKDRPLIRLFP